MNLATKTDREHPKLLATAKYTAAICIAIMLVTIVSSTFLCSSELISYMHTIIENTKKWWQTTPIEIKVMTILTNTVITLFLAYLTLLVYTCIRMWRQLFLGQLY